jgi:uncharacterized coiled-coil protein SlyX
MADSESFSNDISGLWGVREDPLEPPRPNGTVTNGHAPKPAPTNGSHVETPKDDPRDTVARLADALAGHQVDIVRHSELSAMRTEMEDGFAQRLAVALFELLSASKEQFSSVEDHVDARLHEVVRQVGESLKAEGDRLTLAIDIQQRATADLARSARDELVEISNRFSGPMDDLASFQREMRHEVGRVGDEVAAHGVEAARRAEENAERANQAGAALSRRLESTEMRSTEAMEKITETIASVQRDLSDIHDALRALREEVSSLRGSAGARRRWGRSG